MWPTALAERRGAMSDDTFDADRSSNEAEAADTIGSLDWWKQRLTEVVNGDAAFQKAMREELRNAGDLTPDTDSDTGDDFTGSFSC